LGVTNDERVKYKSTVNSTLMDSINSKFGGYITNWQLFYDALNRDMTSEHMISMTPKAGYVHIPIKRMKLILAMDDWSSAL